MADYAPVDLAAGEQVEFELNGRRVTAPAGTMLVDAAYAHGVEVPVFCYEPRLGAPIGACRMCLVEVEGMRGLQTACSTPVQPDMVVRTNSEIGGRRPGRRAGVPAREPPPRLPGVRQGRRVPAPGPHVPLRPRQDPLRRDQAPLPEAARPVVADRARPRALHLVLPLRALQPGRRRGQGADHGGPRRGLRDRHLHRRPVRGPLHRQRHRPLPGRRAHEHPLPLRRPALGHHQHAVGLRPRRHGRQRRADRPRGQYRPRHRPPGAELRGGGGLALRPRRASPTPATTRPTACAPRSSATATAPATRPSRTRSTRPALVLRHGGRGGHPGRPDGDGRGGLPRPGAGGHRPARGDRAAPGHPRRRASRPCRSLPTAQLVGHRHAPAWS